METTYTVESVPPPPAYERAIVIKSGERVLGYAARDLLGWWISDLNPILGMGEDNERKGYRNQGEAMEAILRSWNLE